jgi:hypothetical protein
VVLDVVPRLEAGVARLMASVSDKTLVDWMLVVPAEIMDTIEEARVRSDEIAVGISEVGVRDFTMESKASKLVLMLFIAVVKGVTSRAVRIEIADAVDIVAVHRKRLRVVRKCMVVILFSSE